MRDEISAAVLFLVRLIEKGERFNQDQLEHFKIHLSRLLVERCQNHWFPEKPDKGQGYRCIRVNGLFHDPILKKAACASGMKYEDINLPYELTIWVDPNEVCCRFGETNSSFCTLASFNSKKSVDVPICESVTKEHLTPTSSPLVPVVPMDYLDEARLCAGRLLSARGASSPPDLSPRQSFWSPPSSPARRSLSHYYQHWPHKYPVKV